MISPVRLSSCSPASVRRSSSFAPSCSAATTTSTVRLGRRWGEYQGTNNWDGLLDPLDDILRSEILRYGQFVQAAYTSFNDDQASPAYASCRYSRDGLLHRSGLGHCGYRVTRNLHTTSGIQLPTWVDTFVSGRSSWIGYVAVCQDEEEIARLGRRDIVIAYRGTVTAFEWLENLRATLTHLPSTTGQQPEPMVEQGFWNLFTNPGPLHRSLRDELRDEIRRLIDTYGGNDNKPLSLTITGHSLGAALAVLSAYDITATFDDAPMVTVVSFGGPRVGNSSFRCRLEERGSKVLRIVNTQDIITKVPGFVVEEEEEDMAPRDNNGVVLPKWLISKSGWVYADIGCVPAVKAMTTDKLFDEYFLKKNVKDFDAFHKAFLSFTNDLNGVLLGVHYSAPAEEDIKKYFVDWTNAKSDDEKKEVIVNLLKEHVKEIDSDNSTVVFTGLVAPPAAMVLKRAGHNVPQIRMLRLNLVPDWLFVPSITFLSIAGAKFLQIRSRTAP
ncbi:hypothetical protein J5N97_025211 [Dioscorea zingiberensis]|uniref:Fungal lipase-type domain-containing protein n=1 Tax=Dioscorea zingiberensis TaxID=325984 RepID=A0A9D5C8W3_9LILI|nr:hypothetical protein J5N97_025211 [Dioscorea zingiberensis]